MVGSDQIWNMSSCQRIVKDRGNWRERKGEEQWLVAMHNHELKPSPVFCWWPSLNKNTILQSERWKINPQSNLASLPMHTCTFLYLRYTWVATKTVCYLYLWALWSLPNIHLSNSDIAGSITKYKERYNNSFIIAHPQTQVHFIHGTLINQLMSMSILSNSKQISICINVYALYGF